VLHQFVYVFHTNVQTFDIENAGRTACFAWLVLICCERKVLLAGCWWLVCFERKVLLAGD
jgi:hypothetical protein